MGSEDKRKGRMVLIMVAWVFLHPLYKPVHTCMQVYTHAHTSVHTGMHFPTHIHTAEGEQEGAQVVGQKTPLNLGN